jgi:hypothetical protein
MQKRPARQVAVERHHDLKNQPSYLAGRNDEESSGASMPIIQWREKMRFLKD